MKKKKIKTAAPRKIRKKLLVANWKMNPATPREARELFSKIKRAAGRSTKAAVVVCPPAIFLPLLKGGQNLALGGQDIFGEPVATGAYTGAISAPQLKYADAEYVIIGHSETRSRGDDEATVRLKVKIALRSGLRVILCVGERERDLHGRHLQFIRQELESALVGVPKTALVPPLGGSNLIVAYEPLWAVGVGAKTADTPADFLEQAIFIRKVLSHSLGAAAARSLTVLYGGSVDEKNARDFLTLGEADGLLVGRASLRADSFAAIIAAAG